MARDAEGTSPSEQSGGDDARVLYDELTDDLLYDPAIGRATMMGYPCVRLAGRFLASYDDKAGCLVVKLPRQRVTGLVEERSWRLVAPAGKVFGEWVSIPTVDRELWQTLLAETVDFAARGWPSSADSTSGQRHAASIAPIMKGGCSTVQRRPSPGSDAARG
jgi:hypothetical protein